MGQAARYQRYTAELLFVIASGQRIDPDKSPKFKDILQEIYRDPFEKKAPQPMTAEEIKSYLVRKMEDYINGSAAPCRKD